MSKKISLKRKKLTEFLIIFLVFAVSASASALVSKFFIKDDSIKEEKAVVLEPEKELPVETEIVEAEEIVVAPEPVPAGAELTPVTNAVSSNCTIKFGNLMLINPNFHVETSFIATRKTELINLAYNYGIKEANPNNGANLMDSTAASHLNEMLMAYRTEYPGHEMMTRSCFREKGTNCGRLCLATGTTDHHTGLTCDLIDQAYGSSLDTSLYNQHIEWQWLKKNSYKYGFIDRFPSDWSGGPMSEPMHVNANGSTGLFETWHYRYVGIEAANEIATGKYNNGNYDSLEHYLKARELVTDLVGAKCKV